MGRASLRAPFTVSVEVMMMSMLVVAAAAV